MSVIAEKVAEMRESLDRLLEMNEQRAVVTDEELRAMLEQVIRMGTNCRLHKEVTTQRVIDRKKNPADIAYYQAIVWKHGPKVNPYVQKLIRKVLIQCCCYCTPEEIEAGRKELRLAVIPSATAPLPGRLQARGDTERSS